VAVAAVALFCLGGSAALSALLRRQRDVILDEESLAIACTLQVSDGCALSKKLVIRVDHENNGRGYISEHST
jgi:hypothetical protein